MLLLLLLFRLRKVMGSMIGVGKAVQEIIGNIGTIVVVIVIRIIVGTNTTQIQKASSKILVLYGRLP